MRLKKINALLSLLASVLLLEHTLFSTVLLFRGKITGMPVTAMLPLVISTGLHALVSIGLLLFAHDRKTAAPYRKENGRTVFQRISGIAVLALFIIHASTYDLVDKGGMNGPAGLMKTVQELLFIPLCLAHLSASFRNAFLSLGWVTTEKGTVILDRIIRIAVIAVGVPALAGTLIFFIRRAL